MVVRKVLDKLVEGSNNKKKHHDLEKEHKKLFHYYENAQPLTQNQARFPHAYMVQHKETGDIRTVRILPKQNLPDEFFLDQVQLFQSLFHPNLCNLYETLEDRKHCYFILDRLDRPNIYRAIPLMFPNASDFDERQVALLIRTILKTLVYLHKHGMCHTNLSYEYLLLDPKKGLQSVILTGFGQARVDRQDTVYQHSQRLGVKNHQGGGDYETNDNDSDSDSDSDTEDESEAKANDNSTTTKMASQDLFAAPETRWGDLSIYESSSDIWSLGVITYQLLARRHPFENPAIRPKSFQDDDFKTNHLQTTSDLQRVSPEAKDFLAQALTYRHVDRPTAEQAFQHPWLQSADNMHQQKHQEAVLDALTNLQNFDAETKLAQSARQYIVNNLLSECELNNLDKIFQQLDRANDQVLTKKELRTALRKQYGKERQTKIGPLLEQIFDRIDTDQNGQIDYSEFLAAAADDSMLWTHDNLRATFDAFDVTKTGTITHEDLQRLFHQGRNKKLLSKRDAKRLMRQADADGDGEISFEEFCALMLGEGGR